MISTHSCYASPSSDCKSQPRPDKPPISLIPMLFTESHYIPPTTWVRGSKAGRIKEVGGVEDEIHESDMENHVGSVVGD